MSKRILFVDDELMVLKGLERSLRSMRKEWEMEFVLGGPEALEAMAHEPFDVVVSDMRMPGMDGAQLLDLVKKRFSQTVRMVLSGQSDKDAVLRAIRPTHQYLSKPCDVEELKQKLGGVLALRDVLDNPQLKQKVSQLETLPSPPSLYDALRTELESPNPSLQAAADIVSSDPAMTAKLLQLVNSAFLGSASRLFCPKQAISIIGLENLHSLVTSVGLFSEMRSELAEILTPLWRHANATARFAKAIARCEQAGPTAEQECCTAGLLHDVGWIVLAATYEEQFVGLCSLLGQASSDRGALDQAKTVSPLNRERAVFGGTHGQVGTYLLGLWGLPDSILEAVAWHHAPAQAHPTSFCPLLAVHAANHCDGQLHPSLPWTEGSGIDQDLLAQLGLQDRWHVWQKQCQEIDEQIDDKSEVHHG
jgi:HD-like signal output (HDOD) protein/CheY-like chemotaxis protein